MIVIALALVSVGLFGAHVWELYQNVRIDGGVWTDGGEL